MSSRQSGYEDFGGNENRQLKEQIKQLGEALTKNHQRYTAQAEELRLKNEKFEERQAKYDRLKKAYEALDEDAYEAQNKAQTLEQDNRELNEKFRRLETEAKREIREREAATKKAVERSERLERDVDNLKRGLGRLKEDKDSKVDDKEMEIKALDLMLDERNAEVNESKDRNRRLVIENRTLALSYSEEQATSKRFQEGAEAYEMLKPELELLESLMGDNMMDSLDYPPGHPERKNKYKSMFTELAASFEREQARGTTPQTPAFPGTPMAAQPPTHSDSEERKHSLRDAIKAQIEKQLPNNPKYGTDSPSRQPVSYDGTTPNRQRPSSSCQGSLSCFTPTQRKSSRIDQLSLDDDEDDSPKPSSRLYQEEGRPKAKPEIQYVDRPVEVIKEKIVYKYRTVEVRVKVPVEVPVEKVVKVEVPIETIVYQDKEVEKIVEIPGETQYIDRTVYLPRHPFFAITYVYIDLYMCFISLCHQYFPRPTLFLGKHLPDWVAYILIYQPLTGRTYEIVETFKNEDDAEKRRQALKSLGTDEYDRKHALSRLVSSSPPAPIFTTSSSSTDTTGEDKIPITPVASTVGPASATDPLPENADFLFLPTPARPPQIVISTQLTFRRPHLFANLLMALFYLFPPYLVYLLYILISEWETFINLNSLIPRNSWYAFGMGGNSGYGGEYGGYGEYGGGGYGGYMGSGRHVIDPDWSLRKKLWKGVAELGYLGMVADKLEATGAGGGMLCLAKAPESNIEAMNSENGGRKFDRGRMVCLAF